jgi:hypothetical protein
MLFVVLVDQSGRYNIKTPAGSREAKMCYEANRLDGGNAATKRKKEKMDTDRRRPGGAFFCSVSAPALNCSRQLRPRPDLCPAHARSHRISTALSRQLRPRLNLAITHHVHTLAGYELDSLVS